MRVLSNRISEVCESYPKLSGLNALVPKNFKKKTENGFVELKPMGLIGENIQPRDLLYFDLHFYEIWLDIQMALESRNRSYIITFELKVISNCVKSEFENTLINLGIQSWAKIVNDDYYAFTELNVDYPSVFKLFNNSSSKINTQINNSSPQMNMIQSTQCLNNFTNKSFHDSIITFDFDSKLKCRLVFTNISELIIDQAEKGDTNKLHSFSGKEIETLRDNCIKTCLNNYFEDWILNKTDSIAVYKQIIWRFKLQYDHIIIDDDISSCSSDSLNLSIKSIIDIDIDIEESQDYRADSTGNFTNHCQKSPLNSPRQFRGKSFEKDQKIPQALYYTKFNQETSFNRTSIDYSSIVNKYASLYIPLKEFNKNPPDTRNLVELCNEIIENFEIEVKDVNTNYSHKEILKGSEKDRIKKWMMIIGTIVLLFMLYEFLL